jgi:curved DNA-binding protein CbpA
MTKSLYDILGILPDAEEVVIKAAYRSLSQKWHPDKHQGSTAAASERMAEINRAYEVLGDPVRRKAYDDELRKSGESNRFDSTTDADPLEAEPDGHDWQIAASYFPKIVEQFDYLKRLDPALAFAFREVLLSTKKFDQSIQLFESARSAFLSRYFGDDRSIQNTAELLIIWGFRSVAVEINDVVRILGSSVPSEKLIAPILDRNCLAIKDGKVFVRKTTHTSMFHTAESDAARKIATKERFKDAVAAIKDFRIASVSDLVSIDKKLLDFADEKGNSLLVYAVLYKAGTIFQFLVESGANVEFRTADGRALAELISSDPHMLEWSKKTMLDAIRSRQRSKR